MIGPGSVYEEVVLGKSFALPIGKPWRQGGLGSPRWQIQQVSQSKESHILLGFPEYPKVTLPVKSPPWPPPPLGYFSIYSASKPANEIFLHILRRVPYPLPKCTASPHLSDAVHK